MVIAITSMAILFTMTKGILGQGMETPFMVLTVQLITNMEILPMIITVIVGTRMATQLTGPTVAHFLDMATQLMVPTAQPVALMGIPPIAINERCLFGFDSNR